MPFAAVGAITAVAGLGMSAASAAGAFNGKVDSFGPTNEELAAARYNQQVFDQGQQWQKQLDPVYLDRLDKGLESAMQQAAYLKGYQGRLTGLGRELKGLDSQQNYQAAANRAVNQTWSGFPQAQQQMTQIAARSGGPGSGQFLSQLGNLAGTADNAVRNASVQGRMNYLNEVNARRGQYGQQIDQFGQRLDAVGNALGSYADQAQGLFQDYSNRIQGGLGMMTQGAGQAQQAQANRINAQVQNNAAMSSAMSGLGGAMVGAGMGAVSAGGGMAGIKDGFYSIGNAAGKLI